MKELATHSSAANKAYTIMLNKFKTQKAAARQARADARDAILAHHMTSIELMSIGGCCLSSAK